MNAITNHKQARRALIDRTQVNVRIDTQTYEQARTLCQNSGWAFRQIVDYGLKLALYELSGQTRK